MLFEKILKGWKISYYMLRSLQTSSELEIQVLKLRLNLANRFDGEIAVICNLLQSEL